MQRVGVLAQHKRTLCSVFSPSENWFQGAVEISVKIRGARAHTPLSILFRQFEV